MRSSVFPACFTSYGSSRRLETKAHARGVKAKTAYRNDFIPPSIEAGRYFYVKWKKFFVIHRIR